MGDVPHWLTYFDAAEHAGAKAASARDLAERGRPTGPASTHFESALALRGPGFERVRIMDAVGHAAALFDEGDPDRGAQAAHHALDDAARLDSALITSRVNVLHQAIRPYRTATVDDIRARIRDLTATRPSTIAA
ncbi:hypothetical protein [Streptomyces buecherae]|uniref:hypothetical protein n=1 Tax=Streptomyces buecherae TaxID=2763006 RepID=UPI001E3C5D72|nr:hypothetical protein [Streptomyces buecherae]